ncbi:unnamed protein product [Sphagnum jensenii]|uniref:Uncharacterized protein n=1 Tax=Sphagnum jensenii TaxID=128206 RepID=A0ABP1AGQ4_9BRYO
MIPQNNTCGRDEAKYPSLKRLGSAAWMRPSRACRSRTDGMYPLSYSHSPKEKMGWCIRRTGSRVSGLSHSGSSRSTSLMNCSVRGFRFVDARPSLMINRFIDSGSTTHTSLINGFVHSGSSS